DSTTPRRGTRLRRTARPPGSTWTQSKFTPSGCGSNGAMTSTGPPLDGTRSSPADSVAMMMLSSGAHPAPRIPEFTVAIVTGGPPADGHLFQQRAVVNEAHPPVVR